ncbi:efflux transporter outer membrane subunit [Aquincola sp. MAHUQ-54]|uniref:Efflux transporter outer membrane subunit n=1 Tax=Aquincola agrisoli TaxID=3119538 RepID=A0AAW9QMM5_9BURK
MNLTSRLTVLAAAALLAACGSMAPHYERPAAPVSPTYPATVAGAIGGTPAADIEWQRFFEDARIRRLIELALQNNRDLRVAVLNIERTRAQYQVQRADRLPSVSGVASLTREPNAQGDQTSLYSVGLGVTSYELDLFGRVRSLSDAALGQYLATEEGRKAAQISLVGSVARAALAIQADEELLALTRQTLATREDSLKLAQLRFDNGVASELDLQLARSLMEAARTTLAQQQRQRELDENALVLLVGQPLPADLPPVAPLAQTRLVDDVPAGLPADLLARRPDLRQSEQLLVSANANIGAAKAAFFPRITLTGSAGTASNELSGLFKDGSGAWTFMPQITLPIFDAGRNRANLDVANANRDIALAQYEKAVQTAFREVADALAGRATLGEQLRSQQAQADAENARFRLSDLRYRNGVASYLDLLDAQRSLFTVQQAALQTRLAQLQNQVTLYQVLGGGWTEAPAPQAAR